MFYVHNYTRVDGFVNSRLSQYCKKNKHPNCAKMKKMGEAVKTTASPCVLKKPRRVCRPQAAKK